MVAYNGVADLQYSFKFALTVFSSSSKFYASPYP
jgi:hypothetical protein